MRLRQLARLPLIALFVSHASIAMADGVLPTSATAQQRDQAQTRFAHAKELFGKQKFDEALAEFRASSDVVASPNTRLEIARTLRAMAKYVTAFVELRRTQAEAKALSAQDSRYQRAYDAATAERAELEPLLGFVALTVQNSTDETRVTLEGDELRRADWAEPVPVYGGKAEIDVETPGHAPVKKSVSVAAGTKTSLTIDAQSGTPDAPAESVPAPPPPEPPPTPPPPPPSSNSALRVGAYVAGGVGLAGIAMFAIGGVMARSTYNDLSNTCGNGPCSPDKAGEISSGKTQQTVANVGLALGVLGVAGGVTLFVLSIPKTSSTSTAAVVVSPTWVGVRGSL
jgi:hypothetical protein